MSIIYTSQLELFIYLSGFGSGSGFRIPDILSLPHALKSGGNFPAAEKPKVKVGLLLSLVALLNVH